MDDKCSELVDLPRAKTHEKRPRCVNPLCVGLQGDPNWVVIVCTGCNSYGFPLPAALQQHC